ncbi:kynurenine formamidase isoform 1-T1 [Sarcoramphus papa]
MPRSERWATPVAVLPHPCARRQSMDWETCPSCRVWAAALAAAPPPPCRAACPQAAGAAPSLPALAHGSLSPEAFTCVDTRRGPTWQPWCCPRIGRSTEWCRISKVAPPCPGAGAEGELVSAPGTRPSLLPGRGCRGCRAEGDELPQRTAAHRHRESRTLGSWTSCSRGCACPAPTSRSLRPGAVGARSCESGPSCRVPHPPAPLPPGAVLVSGVYDLEPILHTYVNDALNMSREVAQRNSPMLCVAPAAPAAAACEVLVAVAQHDSPEFRRQSQEYGQALRAAGWSVSLLDLAGMDHFDIIEKLSEDSYILTQVILNMISRA